MFETIQHIGYLVDDLEKAVGWFRTAFGAEHFGGGTLMTNRTMPSGGRNAFMQFGATEVELMQPGDTRHLPKGMLVMHHVGYAVADIPEAVEKARAKGLKFLADAPFTNPVGQQVLYFDPDTTNGIWMHLTKVPPRAAPRPVAGPAIEGIVHPGYLVQDVGAAAAWYADKLGGRNIGGGPSRRGGRVAFIDIGNVQVELIEPPDAATMGAAHVLDHVGYITKSISDDMPAYRARGLAFQTEEPVVNPVGQKLVYFDTTTSMGSRMHLTELPK